MNSIPTNWVARGQPAADLMKLIGGKGNVVLMHGEPSVSQDIQSFQAFNAVLSQCPNVKVVGTLEGDFNPPTAKSAMLEFLATHPGSVDAVLQPGTGFAAIIQAFQQAGRKVPPIMDSPGSDGGFGYWINTPGYQDAADVWGPLEHGDELSHIALRVLNGQGPKINSIFEASALVTNANLKDFASTEWTLNTPGYVDGPPSTWFWTSANLDAMFNHPELKLP